MRKLNLRHCEALAEAIQKFGSYCKRLDCFALRARNDVKGFTLAEVLITLGIIGVVAALVMPALMASYQKKVITTRLKKFHSVMLQAVRMLEANDIAFNGGSEGSDETERAAKYWAQFEPFINTTDIRNTSKGITVGFADGSGVYLWGRDDGVVRLGFCPEYKNCKTIDESKINVDTLADGKKIFYFYNNGALPTAEWDGQDRDFLLDNCAGSVQRYCSTLIWFDGWEIRDDYPW